MESQTTELELITQPGQPPIVVTPKPADVAFGSYGSPPITPAQAKTDAIAGLTMAAYQKASQLTLTEEEIAALTADFPDEAFKPGAAGKENLIYIEHAFLRDRLNAVFKPGQWAIVPRNRWAESFRTTKGNEASRVYVEAMLCIRGCFAAEAVGEMEYYPNNPGTNYGDAVEGAKSAALRRCCKEIGIGLQAWKRDWRDGWWGRKRGLARPASEPANQAIAPDAITADPKTWPANKTAAKTAAKTVDVVGDVDKWLINCRDRVIELLKPHWFILWNYALAKSWILPTEAVTDIPAKKMFPSVKVDAGITDENKEAAQKDKETVVRAVSVMADGKEQFDNFAEFEVVHYAPPAQKPNEEPDDRAGGKIEFVSKKEGTSKKGPWTRYGVKLGGKWHSTFDHKLGAAAEDAHKAGREVTLHFNETERGRELVALV